MITSTERLVQRVAALVVCLAALGGTPQHAAASGSDPVPCTEYEECLAFGELQADCEQDNGSNPEHQMCAWYISGCFIHLGHMHWFGQCYDNGPEECPGLFPCEQGE